MASAVMSAAVTVRVSAAIALMDIFSVQAVFQFLFRRLPYGNDFSCKIQGLSCHRRVEIHFYGLFIYFQNLSRNNTAHAVYQRNGCTRNEKVFHDLSVYLESFFRKVDYAVRIHFSISFGRCKGETEFSSRFKTFYVLFEFFQKRTCPVYVVERFFLSRPVDDLSVDFEFVAEFHYLVFSYIHFLKFLCFRSIGCKLTYKFPISAPVG